MFNERGGSMSEFQTKNDRAESKQQTNNILFFKVSIIVSILGIILFIYVKSGNLQTGSVIDFFTLDSKESKIEFYKTSGSAAHYAIFDDKVVQYSQREVQLLDIEKKVLWKTNYIMNQPIFKKYGNTFILFDYDGRELYVFTNDGIKYHQTLPYAIQNVALNSKGICAVITGQQKGVDVLFVFNEKGTQVLKRIHEASAILGASINDIGDKLVLALLKSQETKIKSEVVIFQIYNPELKQYNSDVIIAKQEYDKMILSVQFSDDDSIRVLGQDFITVLSAEAKSLQNSQVTAPLMTMDWSGTKTSVLLTEGQSELDNRYSLYFANDTDHTVAVHTISMTEKPRGIRAEEDGILIYTARKLYFYNFSAEPKWSTNTFMDIEDVFKINRNQVLIDSRDKAVISRPN